jgi:arabinogalactan endo-1,4-beta-galactosidase
MNAPIRWHICLSLLAIAVIFSFRHESLAADQSFIAGADISMLPAIEKAGGVYRQDGKPADAIQILRDHGCNMFRVRLFVKPSTDFTKTYGAVQDLDYVRALAKRIKKAGGGFTLDIHYSDTWADPGKQFTPADWKSLDFDALKRQVGDYTTSVLKDLQTNDCLPDMVQVGNEITAGMLWPLGKVVYSPPDTVENETRQWKRFAELFNAGAAAVRKVSADSKKPIRIILHIHGGGRDGLPKWFFGKFNSNPADYDVIGLSFYPAFDDSLDNLKQNLQDVIQATGKDVILSETSYPWKTLPDQTSPAMQWPQTKEGQKKFLEDLTTTLHAAPDHHVLGFMWWYPEAIHMDGLNIWRDGGEGLFDDQGNALPALDVYRQNTLK